MQISEVAKKFGMTPDTLRYYEKVMDISVSTPVTQTPASIVTLDTSLANLVQTPITGYLLEKEASASTTPNVVDSYTAKLSVDMTRYDPTTMTALHKSNSFANVEFSTTDTKDTLQQKLTSKGYTCQ